MKHYLDLLQKIIDQGSTKTDRTGIGTKSLFGYQMEINLSEGFPLLTTKKVHLRSVIYELLWFLKGDTNIHFLNEHKVSIWDEWADKNGDLGPVYGKQWRAWKDAKGQYHDQITALVRGIKKNPNSRRHIVNAWNVGAIQDMALPPCHCMFQFYVSGEKKLSCQLYQRSADIFLGVPFNIASYALFTMMVAQVCGLQADRFIHTFGDVHLYNNHIQQAKLQLSRNPLPLPQMILNPEISNIFDFTFKDFQLTNYHPHPPIKAPIAI